MRETSLQAFSGIEATLPAKRKRVLDAIRETGTIGATLFELVKTIGRPVNEISGRVTELSKSGLIIGYGRRVNPDTKKESMVWHAVERSKT